ncbi:unnamed protein product [Bursaphelenchus okinawaensis]|uniref:Transcription factor CBF/NF-Y/archaeal histone domain-containing protein n=1 Tax=Bursaphelenchus okinawaensis TaxID=465554 RepID=A0A811KQP7_9BILA|nr:unnamed protein product [Bursaphelenchus okinawaensis]CAG9110735.1 unnamed protein product [Bursaphelenchus okinawaensis]
MSDRPGPLKPVQEAAPSTTPLKVPNSLKEALERPGIVVKRAAGPWDRIPGRSGLVSEPSSSAAGPSGLAAGPSRLAAGSSGLAAGRSKRPLAQEASVLSNFAAGPSSGAPGTSTAAPGPSTSSDISPPPKLVKRPALDEDKPCLIPTEQIRALLDEDGKKKHKQEVVQVLAAGTQAMCEDLFECAMELASKEGRKMVSAEDINKCLANVMYRY